MSRVKLLQLFTVLSSALFGSFQTTRLYVAFKSSTTSSPEGTDGSMTTLSTLQKLFPAVLSHNFLSTYNTLLLTVSKGRV